MDCEQLQEKLSEYLERSLDQATHEAVESHLSACPVCGGEEQALRQGIRSVADLPPVEPPPGFSQRVMAHIREEAQRQGLWDRLFHPLSMKLPIQATVLILIGVLAVLVYRTNQPVEREIAKSMPVAKAPSERSDLPAKKDRLIPAIPSSSSRGVSLEDQVKSLDEVFSGELRRAEEEMLETGRALGLHMRRELSNEPLGPADFELVFTPRKSLEGVKVLGREFDDLVGRPVGGFIQHKKEAAGKQKQSRLVERETLWLTLSQDRYEQLKKDLASLGKIETVVPTSTEGFRATEKAPAGLLRIKLTILFPKGP